MQKLELPVLMGRNIVSLRKKLNMTQKVLADHLKITTDSLRKIEKGTMSPKMKRFQDIADALQCSVSTLFVDTDYVDTNELANFFADSMNELAPSDRQYLFEVFDATLGHIKRRS